jgi:hypothetical protein
MSPRFRRLLHLVALLPGLALAQPAMPVMGSGELPGLEVLEVQSYAGKALYGYIDGGAELYREYGFDRVTVQVLRLGKETFHAEIFRMSDPGAAFGIYCVSRGECAPDDSLPASSCVSPFAIQWAQSRYFVRIANETASPGAQADGIRIARALSAKIHGENWKIPPVLAAAGATDRTILLIRGVLGIQNGFDQWSPLVDGLENFEAAIVSRDDSSGQTIVAEIRFAADTDRERFSRAFSRRGMFLRSLPKSEHRLLLLESSAPADSLWSRLLIFP